ncbi:MAG: hypothetical protein K2P81_12990 [Bacteriovoracaceae bacterium]|nr:hypothetical protein [Bacteriovoracaceae bacterium]
MKIISSKLTFYQKKLFPRLWFLLVFALIGIHGYLIWSTGLDYWLIFLDIGLLGIGYFAFKKYFLDLVDFVEDHQEFLRIGNNGLVETIGLHEIKEIQVIAYMNPNIVIVHLKNNERKIKFLSRLVFFGAPLKPSYEISNLIKRVGKEV